MESSSRKKKEQQAAAAPGQSLGGEMQDLRSTLVDIARAGSGNAVR